MGKEAVVWGNDMKRWIWLALLLPTFAFADPDLESFASCAAGSPVQDCIHINEADARFVVLEESVGGSLGPQQLPAVCVANATHAHGAIHIMGGWIVKGHGLGDGPHNVELHHFSKVDRWKATDRLSALFEGASGFSTVAVGFSGFDAAVCLEELLALMTNDSLTIIWSGP